MNIVPLLAVGGPLRTGGRALVAGITRNTHIGV